VIVNSEGDVCQRHPVSNGSGKCPDNKIPIELPDGFVVQNIEGVIKTHKVTGKCSQVYEQAD